MLSGIKNMVIVAGLATTILGTAASAEDLGAAATNPVPRMIPVARPATIAMVFIPIFIRPAPFLKFNAG